MDYAVRVFRRVINRLWILARWIGFAVFTGLVLGIVCAAFSFCLRKSIAARIASPEMILLLPIGGLLIVGFYKLLDYSKDGGTNLVLESIQSGKEIPLRMTPLIFVSTVITQAFGGSAGREGAALQIGGSIGNFLGKIFKLNKEDKKVFIMSGMSAAFSALFGTPIAASVFSMEVVSVGVMQYSALVPCTIASLMASAVAVRLGAVPESFSIMEMVDFSAVTAMKTIFLACLCAGVSVIFCIILRAAHKFMSEFFTNVFTRVLIGGSLIIIITILLRTWDYTGTGMELIAAATEGRARPLDFVWKILFTAITLASGFKGGEIVPSLCIGATFGCFMGTIIGMSPSLCAAIGMVSIFCGVTNCPISSLLIALELFGIEAVPFFLLSIAISYMLSGYYGLYHSQRFAYSKYRAKSVNVQVH